MAVGHDIQDAKQRRVIHFAAAAESSAPLQLLILRGASVDVADEKGRTPLMLAAKYGRVENVKLILTKLKEEIAASKKLKKSLQNLLKHLLLLLVMLQ